MFAMIPQYLIEAGDTMKLCLSFLLYFGMMAALCYACVRGFEDGCLGAVPLIVILFVMLYCVLRLIVNTDDSHRGWVIAALVVAAVAALVPLGIRIAEEARERN